MVSAGPLERSFAMLNDNALLPPTIHLGYLPDDELIAHVSRAKESIRFVGPGLSVAVARALAAHWSSLNPSAVEVVLDADSDLCRLGFGDGEALAILLQTAERMGKEIFRQPGVRLCVMDIEESA
jgi:hypothetical protein